MTRHAGPSSQLLAARRAGASGQSIVESTLVILLVCLIFFGFLQVAVLYNHERVLQFASFAAARSATVGFLPEIYDRAYKVAAIPASGSNLTLTAAGPKELLAYEQITIPLYLNRAVAMDYEYWEEPGMSPVIQFNTPGSGMLQEFHEQTHPLVIPLAGAYYQSRPSGRYEYTVSIPNESSQAWHYQHYLK